MNLELTVIRRFFSENYTIGKLTIDQVRITDTLEDKVRDLQDINHDGDFTDPGEGKIMKETAIPYGRYQVIVNYSPKLGRRLPLLLKVPGFEGIRIHAGKNYKWTEGCILVGDNKSKGTLENGPYYETKIIQMIDEAIENGRKVFLTIKQ